MPQYSCRLCGSMFWKRRLYVPSEGELCPPSCCACVSVRCDSHLCLCAQARYFSSKEDSIDDDGMYTHTHARAHTHTHTQRVWKRACCIATHSAACVCVCMTLNPAVEEIALRFNQSHADGFVYVAAFSFCSPSSIQMASNDVLHAISASDAAKWGHTSRSKLCALFKKQ